MEQKISIAKMRGTYAKSIDKEVRSLSSYLAEINKDFAAYAAGEQAATSRRKESFSFFSACAMKANNLTLAYIKQWYAGIDSKGRICDFKKVELSEECAAAAKYTDFDIIDKDTYSVVLIPVNLWTANKVLTKIAAAMNAEKAAASAAAAAVREQERAAKHAASIERMRAKVAEFDKAQAAASAAAGESKPESKSKSKSASKPERAAASA